MKRKDENIRKKLTWEEKRWKYQKKLTWEEKSVKTTNEEGGEHMEEVQKSLKHRNIRERGERKR